MTNFEFRSLDIGGYLQKSLPNSFLQQTGKAHTLAIIYPGLRYSCDKPLLYYLSRIMLERGADVLQVRSDYTVRDFQVAPQNEKVDWIATDALAAMQTALAQREYYHLILIGKSIGTLAMTSVLNYELHMGKVAIWITPLLYEQELVQAALSFSGPAYFLLGSGDPTFQSDALATIQANTDAQALIIEGANHSLEIPDDTMRSIKIIEECMQGIAHFLDEI